MSKGLYNETNPCVFIKYQPTKQPTNNPYTYNFHSPSTDKRWPSPTNIQARELSSVEQERDQVAIRGNATYGGEGCEVDRRCGFYGCFKCAHQIT